MIEAIHSKEARGLDVAKTYQDKILNCVEKIGSRQAKEREAAGLRATEHVGRFRTLIRDAKAMVRENRQLRERAVEEVRRTVSERQELFNRAISSLEAVTQNEPDESEAH